MAQDKRWRHSKLALSGLSEQQRREKVRKYQEEYYQKVRRPKLEKEKHGKEMKRRPYQMGLTPEERIQRRKEVAAAYYQRNKERLNQRDKERRQGLTPEQKEARRIANIKAYRAKREERKKAEVSAPPPVRQRQRVYQTKEVDTAAMVPVRIDAKTVIYARPGQDIEEIKARYQKTKAA